MALLSNTGVSPSTMTGTLLFGLYLANSAPNWSPLRVSTGMASYSSPASSRNRATFIGFGARL